MEKRLEGRAGAVDIAEAAGIIREGGVAVLPTDTLYGFHADARSREGIERIIKIKGREETAGLLLLSSGMDMVDSLVSDWKYSSRELLSSIWPAPLTAILNAERNLISYVKKNGKVAVRVPDYRWLRDLTEQVGYPLVSTSVNRRGQPPMRRISEIKRVFYSLDLYVEGEEEVGEAPSTIIDFTRKPPALIRSGAFDPPFRTVPPSGD